MSACILCLCSQDLTNIDLFLASREVEEALQQKETLNCLPVSACLYARLYACLYARLYLTSDVCVHRI